jgi:hypothetical protein
MNQTVNERNDTLYQSAQIEEDIPFDSYNTTMNSGNDMEETLIKEDVEDRKQDRIIRGKVTTWCFILIIACLGVIGILYVVDVILINKNLKNSDLSDSIFKLAESSVSILAGYLFAKIDKK